jgi:hypothetical protein
VALDGFAGERGVRPLRHLLDRLTSPSPTRISRSTSGRSQQRPTSRSRSAKKGSTASRSTSSGPISGLWWRPMASDTTARHPPKPAMRFATGPT